tara:strand:+ start:139 stop:399 length:261 start_codon:yes stop_codon:yes gene_type:complete
MNEEHWLINSTRSKVKRFTTNEYNKDKLFEYIFIDSGKIVGVLGKEAPVMQKREELKIEKAREEWKKLISQGWRVTQEVWNKPSDN